MINTDKSFFLHANVTVTYSGRAESTAGPADLCILYKNEDGAILIHGSKQAKAVNYMSSKAHLSYSNNILTSQSKNEKITINIHKTYKHYEIDSWDTGSIQLTGTEKDLCDQIITDIKDLLSVTPQKVEREHRTVNGPIDILVIDTTDTYHIIEVKNKTASINAVTQLRKYSECFDNKKKCYLIAPSASKNAKRLLEEYEYEFIEYSHSTTIDSSAPSLDASADQDESSPDQS